MNIWNIVMDIGELLGAVATAIAVVIALFLPKWKLMKVEFKYPNVYLHNYGQRTIAINRIQLYIGKRMIYESSSDYDVFDQLSMLLVEAGRTQTYKLSAQVIASNLNADEKDNNKKVNVVVIDVCDKIFQHKSKLTKGELLNKVEQYIEENEWVVQS